MVTCNEAVSQMARKPDFRIIEQNCAIRRNPYTQILEPICMFRS